MVQSNNKNKPRKTTKMEVISFSGKLLKLCYLTKKESTLDFQEVDIDPIAQKKSWPQFLLPSMSEGNSPAGHLWVELYVTSC